MPMDASALNNTVGAVDASQYYTYFPAGTYQYELTVPVQCSASDTNDLVCTALVANTDGSTLSIISTCGASAVGDWQSTPIYGVGRFTLPTGMYVAPVIQRRDGYPNIRVIARDGFCTLVWKVWRG
jgi:hypothetical protein